MRCICCNWARAGRAAPAPRALSPGGLDQRRSRPMKHADDAATRRPAVRSRGGRACHQRCASCWRTLVSAGGRAAPRDVHDAAGPSRGSAIRRPSADFDLPAARAQQAAELLDLRRAPAAAPRRQPAGLEAQRSRPAAGPAGQAEAAACSIGSRSLSPGLPARVRSACVSRCITAAASRCDVELADAREGRLHQRWIAARLASIALALVPGPQVQADDLRQRPAPAQAEAHRPPGRAEELAQRVAQRARAPRVRRARSNWRRFHRLRAACSRRWLAASR